MTKIDIFSGFLGAGKTTLIKKLIKEAYTGEQIVLIENEFGEIGIDGGFLQDAGIKITEMNSGCICCSLVGDFSEALKKVEAEYHPDRIVIEPSGVGKLSDVIKAVSNAKLEGAVLNAFCTVVDAGKCKMYMKISANFQRSGGKCRLHRPFSYGRNIRGKTRLLRRTASRKKFFRDVCHRILETT